MVKPGSCDGVKCDENSECFPCAPDGCNTRTCDNPVGENIFCLDHCRDPGPHCLCIKGHHREEPTGPCVPLKCPKTN